MLVKIYWTLWAMVLFVAALLYLTGFLTMTAIVAFGFVIFGLIFMGMMSVLPVSVAHPGPKRVANSPAMPVVKGQSRVLDGIYAFKNELMSSNGVEISKPRFH